MSRWLMGNADWVNEENTVWPHGALIAGWLSSRSWAY